ncbi:family 10 glycosylhydrolase [candidate division KSB1 bacterium]|nr:family 10 glycosylhydrolase [candidate division KSB1 bacterium]
MFDRSPVEIRGVWLTNVDSAVLDSRESIAEAMQFLADHHFNIVFPVVWNDAVTMYPSRVMDSLFNVAIDPRYRGRDPLAELIEEAHKHDIKVIAWFEYGFSASHNKNGGMILRQRKEWAARDRDGNLLTKNGFEWMNAYHPEVQEFMLSLVLEVAKNYDVDGVQGDDRLPAQPIEGGYSDYTRLLYLATHQGSPVPDDLRDPLWQRWRAEKLNSFAQTMYRQVKTLKPGAIVSWAPSIFPWSYDEYLQDWPTWIKDGYADLVIPQNYRYNFQEYVATLDRMLPAEAGLSSEHCIVIPGMLLNVGDYLMDEEYLLNAMKYNRDSGYPGEVFFFYEGLRKNDDAIARKLKQTLYTEKAKLPF